MSARLGCGKGGVSWGSEELLQQVLQVEPGCVTPLALANTATTSCVLLLLDQKLRSGGNFFVHPIVNSASVALDSAGLEAFLRSGRMAGVLLVDLIGPRRAVLQDP